MRRLDVYLRREVPSGLYRGGVVACDSYQRGSALGSTDSLPFLPGIPGKAYTAVAGTWGTTGGVLTPTGTTPGGNGWYASVDPGLVVCTVEMRIAQLSGTSSGPCVRFVDTGNHYQLALGSSLAWFSFASGSGSAVGTNSTGVTVATGDVVVITVNGSNLSAQIVRNGVATGTPATYSSASLYTSASTIAWRSTSTSSKYGNLVVTRL